MIKKNTLLKKMSILGIIGFSSLVNAQNELALYNFNGTGSETCTNRIVAPQSAVANMTFGDMTAVGVTCIATANQFNNDGWNSASNVVDLTEYVEFTMTANSGFQFSLDSLKFDIRASQPDGVYHLRSSVDNYATDLLSDTIYTAYFTEGKILGTGFANLNSITFRFYATSIGAATTTVRLDNVIPHGVVSAVSIVDTDGDGFSGPDDCDETNVNIHVGATEIPNNGIDEDCSGGDLLVSIDENDSNNFTMFPNPGNNELTIKSNDDILNLNVKILDISGKVLSKQSFEKNNLIVLNTSNLVTGIYFIEIQTDKKVSKLQWIKH